MFSNLFLILFLIHNLKGDLTLDWETISYDTLTETDFLNQNNRLIILAVESNSLDKTKINVFNELKFSIEKLNENEAFPIKSISIKDERIKRKYSILRFPQIIFIRDSRYVIYKGEIVLNELLQWIETYNQKKTIDLTDHNFEHDTQASTGATTGDWFVLFHKSGCKITNLIEPTWEQAALRPENRVIFSYVDIDRNPHLKERFSIMNSPTLLFFRQGFMYRYEIGKYDVDTLIAFSTISYKNVKRERIPIEKSWFDKTIDTIVRFLKQSEINMVYVVIGMVITFVLILILSFSLTNKQKMKNSAQKVD